jgi:hypothetical protein
LAAIEKAPDDAKLELRRLTDWALRLEKENLCQLIMSIGKGRWVFELGRELQRFEGRVSCGRKVVCHCAVDP